MIYNDFKAYQASGFQPKVCIVGGGPAGISLALRLAAKRIPCVLLEAGGRTYDADVQAAYNGKVVGDNYFELGSSRLRYLGGSSGHWQGWCRALDAIDFEARPGVPNSGWPIRKTDLDPYGSEADRLLGLPAAKPDQALSADLQEIEFRFSKPIVRFGDKYAAELEKSALIAVALNSPVVDLVPVRGRIAEARIGQAGATPVSLKAPAYALCTGGIENSRLLLWANQQHQGGVVPDARSLGRYWMEHPHYTLGEAALFTFTGFRTPGGMHFYAPTADYLRKHAIGGFGVRLLSGENLIKALIKDGLCVAPDIFTEFAKKASKDLACAAALHVAWEQLPHESNRIELGSDKDAWGMARSVLHWRKQPVERTTADHAVRLVGSYLAGSDKGRVKVKDWLLKNQAYPLDDEQAGFHHMGGTRMAATPAQGVVDANCKVFGVDNLYVGGSSVFPTGGHTNPTYSIVQLALRLGDHLAGRAL